MKNKFSKAVLLLGLAFTVSTAGIAQETKTKIETDDYELKIKQEGDEYKMKEKGRRPATEAATTTTSYRQGQSVTTVKAGSLPQETQTVAQNTGKTAKKKTYAARKSSCTCKKTVARKPAAKKRTVAYRPKTKTTARTTASTFRPAPVVVRDTVYITRVDTVFSINEQSSFTGNRMSGRQLMDNFKKLKIERDDDGIMLKKEYEDGKEIKKTFDTEEEFQTYMEWKNF